MTDETNKPKIEQQNSPTELDILKKRLDELELSIGSLNPRNMAGLRSKDLKQATRANIFGDGSDGDVEVSTPITLERDMFYNNLTVKEGGIINTASFRIFVKNQFIKKAGGIIRNNGNAGGDGGSIGGIGGAAVPSGSLPGGIAGSNGGHCGSSVDPGVAGVAGINAYKSLGSAGSGGGSGGRGGSDYGGVGGAGGSQTGTLYNLPNSFLSAYYLFDTLPTVSSYTLSAGSGGGGGGGTQYQLSGGGGGGAGSTGGMVWIAANRMTIDGENEIQAQGGAGGRGGNGRYNDGSCGGGGGGAGGSGGVIILIYGEKTGTGTLSVAGGPGGAGGIGPEDGHAGADGQPGKIYLIQIQ